MTPPDAPPTTAHCPSCGEGLLPGARFCEACGSAADGSAADGSAVGAPAAGTLPVGTPPVDTPPAGIPDAGTGGGPVPAADDGCARCGAEVGGDGYCTSCGFRALEPIAVDDRGPWASATHRGRRHERNEDAVALAATGEGWPVLVVADGVSTSPNPHLAAAAAVAAAAGRLAGRPFTGEADLEEAVVAAHDAACTSPAAGDPHWPGGDGHPACTIVVAVATDRAVVTANVGDARVHLLCAAGQAWAATQLTTDDSLAARAVAAGGDPIEALNAPGGHTLVAWLGLDAPELAVHLATRPAAPGDLLVASSDGLWNYAATDESLGELAAGVVPPPPATGTFGAAKVAEQLAAWAIAQGGADNVSVALAPVPGAGDPHAPDDEEEGP